METQAPDAFDGLVNPPPEPQPPVATAPAKTTTPRKKTSPRQPRKSHKLSLEGAILGDDKLDPADRKAIVQAGKVGVTVGDLSMLVVYELRTAQRLFASGELAAKDFVVALNKIASQVAAATQLSITSQPGVPSRVQVGFTCNSPFVVDGARERAAPGPCGDIVEVE